MGESAKDRWTPRHPLGVIALSVFLIESIATISLRTVAAKPFASVSRLVHRLISNWHRRVLFSTAVVQEGGTLWTDGSCRSG